MPKTRAEIKDTPLPFSPFPQYSYIFTLCFYSAILYKTVNVSGKWDQITELVKYPDI